MKNYVFLKDTKTVMALYQLVKDDGIKATLAPTPREASHCCGVAILFDNPADQARIEKIGEENKLVIDSFWQTEDKDDPGRMRFC